MAVLVALAWPDFQVCPLEVWVLEVVQDDLEPQVPYLGDEGVEGLEEAAAAMAPVVLLVLLEACDPHARAYHWVQTLEH